MVKLAKLGALHNWSRRHTPADFLPQFFLLSDAVRLPDPGPLLSHLPRGACIVLRHTDPQALARLAADIVPKAHRLGLKVLIAGNMRLALQSGADGVHLSERQARRGRPRIKVLKPGFFLTCAAHNRLALWRARQAGADLVLLSPVFATQSHPNAQELGILRFSLLAESSTVPVIALGGISPINAARLSIGPAYGYAAIKGWRR